MPEPTTYAHLGLAIRALREERGWRQADLAEKVGVAGPYISMLENGKTFPENMKLGTVERFATAFSLHAADLIRMISSQEVEA